MLVRFGQIHCNASQHHRSAPIAVPCAGGQCWCCCPEEIRKYTRYGRDEVEARQERYGTDFGFRATLSEHLCMASSHHDYKWGSQKARAEVRLQKMQRKTPEPIRGFRKDGIPATAAFVDCFAGGKSVVLSALSPPSQTNDHTQRKINKSTLHSAHLFFMFCHL